MTDIEARLRVAYYIAVEAAHAPASTSIHVGPAVMGYLREVAKAACDTPDPASVGIYAWMGISIVPEENVENDHIEVRTRRIIP